MSLAEDPLAGVPNESVLPAFLQKRCKEEPQNIKSEVLEGDLVAESETRSPWAASHLEEEEAVLCPVQKEDPVAGVPNGLVMTTQQHSSEVKKEDAQGTMREAMALHSFDDLHSCLSRTEEQEATASPDGGYGVEGGNNTGGGQSTTDATPNVVVQNNDSTATRGPRKSALVARAAIRRNQIADGDGQSESGDDSEEDDTYEEDTGEGDSEDSVTAEGALHALLGNDSDKPLCSAAEDSVHSQQNAVGALRVAATFSRSKACFPARAPNNVEGNAGARLASQTLIDSVGTAGCAKSREERQIHHISKLPVFRVVNMDCDNDDSNSEEYSCPVCKRTFSADVYDKTHCSPECKRPFRCHMCLRRMISHNALAKHYYLHETSDFSCRECGKKLLNRKSYRTHLSVVHSDMKPHKCDVCNKTFKTVNCLRSHIPSHMSERPYKCEKCGMSFKRKTTLHSHSQKHDPMMGKGTCEVCGKVMSRRHLQLHLSRHSSAFEFKCDVCDKQFATEYYMKQHRQCHFGEAQYVCELCGKSFFTNMHLKSHINKHHKNTREQNHPCEVCGKTFKNRKRLSIHRQIHAEKNLKCDICGFMCNRRDNLLTHIRSHTGERPFECPLCNKSFSRQDNFLNHKRKVHGVDAPSKCAPRATK